MERRLNIADLEPLPLKRQRDVLDRERLAENAHRRQCAKHKGRNHWKNWERRQMAKRKAEAHAPVLKIKNAKFGRYIAEVRAYWRGDVSSHPGKP